MTADARDIEAWEMAIATMRQSGEAVWVNNVDNLLQSRGLAETGKWAAANMQFVTLRSKPWLTLPCNLSDADVDRILARGDGGSDLRGEYAAAVLAKRMQRYGISKYHPNPEQALREAERAKPKSAS
jgi:hypothetical protein